MVGFFLQTGGLSFHKPRSADGVDLAKDNQLKDLPAYLAPEHKESLLGVPSEVIVQSVEGTPGGLKNRVRDRSSRSGSRTRCVLGCARWTDICRPLGTFRTYPKRKRGEE